jgi:hypothetical protein
MSQPQGSFVFHTGLTLAAAVFGASRLFASKALLKRDTRKVDAI